ncbi:MAG: cytochrome P450 [Anaerolineae bacterium]
MTRPIPRPDGKTALAALRSLVRNRNLLYALDVFHAALGDVFELTLPGQRAIVLVGPEASRLVLITGRDKFLWRMADDPVVTLFGGGLLVVDGEEHARLRNMMNPALHRRALAGYVADMVRLTDATMADWTPDAPLIMLDEMRKITLKILTETLFAVDVTPDLARLWQPVLKAIQFISPGYWLLSGRLPRPGYTRQIGVLNAYLDAIIARRRSELPTDADDLLSVLIASGMDDRLIRDQLITLLIAGHDTTTALLAWALHLLTAHPAVLARVQSEVETVLGGSPPTLESAARLPYLSQVIDETLRLYPPVHLGSRLVAEDVPFQDYVLPAGARVMYSIYLTHRHPDYWEEPERFNPDRFDRANKRAIPPYAFLPFGGGPRNCIGAAFGQLEAKVILARVVQRFDLRASGVPIRMSVKATLEPHPGVPVFVHPRAGS